VAVEIRDRPAVDREVVGAAKLLIVKRHFRDIESEVCEVESDADVVQREVSGRKEFAIDATDFSKVETGERPEEELLDGHVDAVLRQYDLAWRLPESLPPLCPDGYRFEIDGLCVRRKRAQTQGDQSARYDAPCALHGSPS